jgi:hypothetical protein
MLVEIGILGENSDNHFDGFSLLCSPKNDSEISRKEKKGSQLPYFNEKVKLAYIRVLCKVRKTQQFRRTEGEMKKKPANKSNSVQQGMKLRKPSSLVVN